MLFYSYFIYFKIQYSDNPGFGATYHPSLSFGNGPFSESNAWQGRGGLRNAFGRSMSQNVIIAYFFNTWIFYFFKVITIFSQRIVAVRILGVEAAVVGEAVEAQFKNSLMPFLMWSLFIFKFRRFFIFLCLVMCLFWTLFDRFSRFL